MESQEETKAALMSKLRKRNIIILKLSSVNRDLKKKIEKLERTIKRLKKPPVHKRVWAFIKQVLRVK
tara:strand:+ start:813 stop:1013 length:201 start_codon:yes stop_codon:yes gene_type:complete